MVTVNSILGKESFNKNIPFFLGRSSAFVLLLHFYPLLHLLPTYFVTLALFFHEALLIFIRFGKILLNCFYCLAWPRDRFTSSYGFNPRLLCRKTCCGMQSTDDLSVNGISYILKIACRMLGLFTTEVLVVSFSTLYLNGMCYIPVFSLKYPFSIALPLISVSVMVA